MTAVLMSSMIMPLSDCTGGRVLPTLLLRGMFQMGQCLFQTRPQFQSVFPPLDTTTTYDQTRGKFRQVLDEYTNQLLVYPKGFVSSKVFRLRDVRGDYRNTNHYITLLWICNAIRCPFPFFNLCQVPMWRRSIQIIKILLIVWRMPPHHTPHCIHFPTGIAKFEQAQCLYCRPDYLWV